MFERTRTFLKRLTGSAKTSEDDRREWERYPSGRETIIYAAPDGASPLTAHIQDVSLGGLRMLVGQPLDEGDMIRVDLPPLDGEPVTSVLACVVHVKPEAGDRWSIGCSFATELNDDDLLALGAKRVRSAGSDQRAWERFPACGQVEYSDAATTDGPRTAAIHNLSPTGVALRMDRRVEPGALLSLEIRGESGHPVLTILGCVVYLSEVGDGRWLAGCNFIRELDDAELRKLT